MRLDERICLYLVLLVLLIFVGGAWWMAIAQLGVGERTVPPGYWRGMAIYMLLSVGLPGILTGWLLWKLSRETTPDTWLWMIPVVLVAAYWAYWYIHLTVPLWQMSKHPELWEAGEWRW